MTHQVYHTGRGLDSDHRELLPLGAECGAHDHFVLRAIYLDMKGVMFPGDDNMNRLHGARPQHVNDAPTGHLPTTFRAALWAVGDMDVVHELVGDSGFERDVAMENAQI
jgi:hypothetical protein